MLEATLKSFIRETIEFIIEDKIAESIVEECYNYIADYQRLLEAIYNLIKRGVKPNWHHVIEEINRLIEVKKLKLKKSKPENVKWD